MVEILVRDIEPATVEGLKARARLHGRSLQKELKLILEASVPVTMTEAGKLAKTWRQRLARRKFSDSAVQLREDRRR